MCIDQFAEQPSHDIIDNRGSRLRQVDFYIAPSKEGYLDWNELIIVVKKVNEKYQLQAVVHNQWMP